MTPHAGPVALDARTVGKIVFGLVALVAVIAVLGAWLRAPITAWSAARVAELGLAGIFLAVYAMDPVPGLGFQPVLFLGYTGGLGVGSLVAVTWAASLVSSVSVYGLGWRLRRSARIVAFLERWHVGGWLRRHGAGTIAVAAVGPLPYGLVTLGAGVMGVGMRALLIGALFRGVKIGATVGAIGLGWG